MGRVHAINPGKPLAGPVIYWMSRDQRVDDHWGLLYSQKLALEARQPLAVVYCLAPRFLDATFRSYRFLLEGLCGLSSRFQELGIPFFVLSGEPANCLPRFAFTVRAGCLVADFDPLKIKQQWIASISHQVRVPFFEVDSHNIVPCRKTSGKQESSARTIRPKILNQLRAYLTEYPLLERHPYRWTGPRPQINRPELENSLAVDRNVIFETPFEPGQESGKAGLEKFITERLKRYDQQAPDPLAGACSDLSPYLHFGQISVQRVAIETLKAKTPPAAKTAFLEELIIRRELADNFCFYNSHYDALDGAPQWALRSLQKHCKDKRPYLYPPEQFERARTHDPLWNAAQLQMARTGKMHGYMRMYWAKKILEWSEDPRQAVHCAIHLNDRYELDGRDPNGYAGILWAIAGLHDRPWPERPVFGQIRYMNDAGCARKFDVKAYIKKYG
ncbi:MAG: deoxyribodipyrimidine photo-lyase [Candidatus Omnitrophica bacterium]|nr:deoxyribodipyrimidine photo-lyase [Candidatus Omnitrophota bacterium]